MLKRERLRYLLFFPPAKNDSAGYFTVSEKCSDFCQDDLADDDIMILDTGEQVHQQINGKFNRVQVCL